jgi:hypothetical protein
VSNLGLRVTGGTDFVRFGSSINYWTFSSVYSPVDNKLEMVSQGGVNYRTKLVNNTYDTRLLVGNYQSFLSFGTYSSQQQMTLFTTGNLAINTTTDAGFRLDVNGTARVTGQFTTDNIILGQGSGGTLKTIITSRAGGAPSIVQTISTVGGGGASENVMQFGCFNGFNSVGQLTIRGDGSNVFEQSSSPTHFATAIVAMNSTTKGALFPRMTSAQRTAIASPATGLLVYQTDGTEGFYVYSGGSWKSLTMV